MVSSTTGDNTKKFLDIQANQAVAMAILLKTPLIELEENL